MDRRRTAHNTTKTQQIERVACGQKRKGIQYDQGPGNLKELPVDRRRTAHYTTENLATLRSCLWTEEEGRIINQGPGTKRYDSMKDQRYFVFGILREDGAENSAHAYTQHIRLGDLENIECDKA